MIHFYGDGIRNIEGLVTWDEYLAALITQFGPSELDDPMDSLAKL